MTREQEKQRENKNGAVRQRKRPPEKRDGSIILVAVVCVLLSAAVGTGLGITFANRSNSIANVTAQMQSVTAAPEQVSGQTEKEQLQAEAAYSHGSITPASEENNLINIIAEAKRNGMMKRAYLTFDDGPSSKVTSQVLDILKKYDIKATFFEVGKEIEKYPDIAKRVCNEGHLIASHSYSHNYDALYATEDSFKAEIEHSERVISELTGAPVDFKLMRFPGGSYNAGDHAAEKQIYKKTLADMGYYYCDWNTLNGDAEGKQKNADELVKFFKSCAASFVEQDKNVIVLMHDSDVKQPTVDALERIIWYLMDKGYTFHRLDDITVR